MHGASAVTEQSSLLPRMVPTQQSAPVRPLPRLLQREPPQVPHPATQQTSSVWTPGKPLTHIVDVGLGVAAELGAGVEAEVGGGVTPTTGAGVGAGVASASA